MGAKVNYARIIELHEQGMTSRRIARELGYDHGAVKAVIDGDDDVYVERPLCKCGLSLPCNSCLTGYQPASTFTVRPERAMTIDDCREISRACDRYIAKTLGNKVSGRLA
jgi:hypothetical protein